MSDERERAIQLSRRLGPEDRTLCLGQKMYGLSFVAAVNLAEAVNAFWQYNQLPQASRDAIALLPNQFGVRVGFAQRMRRGVGQLAVIGISNDLRATYLYSPYPSVEDSNREINSKGCTRWEIVPGGEGVLQAEEWRV